MISLHKTPIKIGVNLGSVAQPQFVRESAALTEVSRFQGSLSQNEQFLLAKWDINTWASDAGEGSKKSSHQSKFRPNFSL